MISEWIDVNDRLPERGEDVLVVMKDVDGLTHTEIRWRSVHKDSVVDKNGFAPINFEQLKINITKQFVDRNN